MYGHTILMHQISGWLLIDIMVRHIETSILYVCQGLIRNQVHLIVDCAIHVYFTVTDPISVLLYLCCIPCTLTNRVVIFV